jgi:hypothetical protein
VSTIRAIPRRLIQQGVHTSRALMLQQDKIWSRYSHDKVDIGETLARVLRTLAKHVPLDRALRALSVGSSTEPQFRLLEANFLGGLYLLDIEKTALDVINERVARQSLRHVFTLHDDYTDILLDRAKIQRFARGALRGKRLDLVAFEHSLYYCPADRWLALFENVFDVLLAPTGAIHCVLMSAQSDHPATTTRLYDHFIGTYFGQRNDQDLLALARLLRRHHRFRRAQILTKTDRVRFFVEDFRALMSVVWMILLYPRVHRYTAAQRREITEHVYRHLFATRTPLFQDQDHLVIYRGVRGKGLI